MVRSHPFAQALDLVDRSSSDEGEGRVACCKMGRMNDGASKQRATAARPIQPILDIGRIEEMIPEAAGRRSNRRE